jgi:vacuolar-type H+-ATPase subunit I/STV1
LVDVPSVVSRVSVILQERTDAVAKAAAELKAKQEAELKVAAELKAKQEAEAKAAAELKAKQEAELKVAAELKAKQEAEAKAAAELKAKQEAELKVAAELKAKQEAADKAAADAKAIADKAAADANRREQLISVLPLRSGIVPLSSTGLPLKVNSTSNLSVFAYNSTNDVCEYQNGMIRTKKSGRCVIAFSQEGNSEFKPAGNLILDFTIAAVTKKTTITCIKGKLTKKVTSLAPQCPAGYKKK